MKLYAIQFVNDNNEVENLSNDLYQTKKTATEAAIEIFKNRFDIDDDPEYISVIYKALYYYGIYIDKDGNDNKTYQITEFNY